MAKRNEMSNWAIAQARDALELYYEQFRGIALDLRLDNVLPTTPSSISSRPAQEYEKPLSLIGHSAIEPTVKTVDKYQTQPTPVNTVGQVNRKTGENTKPTASSRSTSMSVAVEGKTSWPLLHAREFPRHFAMDRRACEPYPALCWALSFLNQTSPAWLPPWP